MHLASLLVIAAAFWGQTPACGQPSISSEVLPGDVAGWAVDPCAIKLNRDLLDTPGQGCMIAIHEYGHLLGLGHSPDPNDVMYPVMRRPVWPCAWNPRS